MNNTEKTAYQASKRSILINFFLTVIKFFGGIFGKSQALISDGIHSLADVVCSFIVILGLKVSHKKEDRKFQYGYDKFESIAAIILAIAICATGLFIGINGFITIINGSFESVSTSIIPIGIALLSIIIKEATYYYIKKIAKKANSDALNAEAVHHRSDVISSVGGLIGLVGARLGFESFDCLASIFIGVWIIKVGIEIFRESIGRIIDKACDMDTLYAIENTILDHEDVIGISGLKSRISGSKIFIDVEIGLNKKTTFNKAVRIALNVKKSVKEKFPEIKDCSVFIKPI